MKKSILAALAGILLFNINAAAAANSFLPEDARVGVDAKISENGIVFSMPYGYVCCERVNLSAVNSIKITATNKMTSGYDGDRILVRLDSPEGDVIGFADIDRHCPDKAEEFYGTVKTITGVHDVYLQSSIASNGSSGVSVKKAEFMSMKYREKQYEPVSEEKIKDYRESTWALTDSLGRRAATYEETGPVREGKKVGMFYWTWHHDFETSSPLNITELVAEHPEAEYDYYNEVWPTSATKYYWNEPLFGYYGGTDYWVYRRHAEMLSAAGVDALFFDTTNGRSSWRRQYQVLFTALHDARESGIDVPKVCFMTSFFPDKYENDIKEILKRIYYGAYSDGKWSDLWFYWEGKPLILAYPETLKAKEGDPYDEALMEEIKSFFTFRGPQASYKTGQVKENQWGWLEVYPQNGYTKNDDGTFEEATVGVAANHSYVTDKITAMNDRYSMGRSYTSVLGQDKKEGAYKYGYFFSEQLERVLELDPELMFIDGWNEWCAGRNPMWNGITNAFPDTYDNERSRDMEPTKGDMKDNYYALLVDAVRKFKGTEKREAAGEEKAIDIHDFSSWEGVKPEFYAYESKYDREGVGYGNVFYESKTRRNNVTLSKVSRDSEKLYFYAECSSDITKESDSDWMKLFIDCDRNTATGREGYDFVINYPEAGDVSRFSADGKTEKIGEAAYCVEKNRLAISVERSVLIDDKAVVDIEFKWADNVKNDVMSFYSEGSVAPLGRFNFVYSEKEEVYLSEEERSALNGFAAVKTGENSGYISGKKISLCDSDTSRRAIKCDGEGLYIPAEFAAEALGVRYVYESEKNMLKLRGKNDVYTVVGTNEARIDGRLAVLNKSVIYYEGGIYIPLEFFSDVYDMKCFSNDDIALFGTTDITEDAVKTAKSLVF